MARYFRGEPSDKSDCGGDETEEKKIRVKFHTTRALPIRSCCQKSKSATRATAYCHSTQGATKGFRTGQLGNVKPPIKTSMRVTKIIILNIHSLTILFLTELGMERFVNE